VVSLGLKVVVLVGFPRNSIVHCKHKEAVARLGCPWQLPKNWMGTPSELRLW
jgi:hypothetical protein